MKETTARVYLLDVEGTVAPVSFVYEQLFPYARKHFREFLIKSLPDNAVRWDLVALAREYRAEADADAPRCLGDGVESLDYIFWLMDLDRKSTALKSLQGKIWKVGFASGELKGTLFADVPDAFARWAAVGRVAIYSSGSVEAQRLVFRHSIFGDLTEPISNYFDTRTGPKGEPASYMAIAAAMRVAPDEVIFFSDAVRELDAARAAGCETRLVVRDGNAPIEDAHGHAAVESFALI
jgi:enolase-phosphatase E1